MLIIFGLAFLSIFIALFILAPLPGRIAKQRNHPQAKAIKTTGWIAILSSSPSSWVQALKWAYEKDQIFEPQILALKRAKKKNKNG